MKKKGKDNEKQVMEALETVNAQPAETPITPEAPTEGPSETEAIATAEPATAAPTMAEPPVDGEPPMPPEPDYAYAMGSLAEADRAAVTQWLRTLTEQIDRQQLSEETIQAVLHAIHYDRDVAQAAIDGETKGRNARIDELFKERRQHRDIHILNGATGSQPSTSLPANLIGALSAADRQNIWERGHEKRVVRN